MAGARAESGFAMLALVAACGSTAMAPDAPAGGVVPIATLRRFDCGSCLGLKVTSMSGGGVALAGRTSGTGASFDGFSVSGELVPYVARIGADLHAIWARDLVEIGIGHWYETALAPGNHDDLYIALAPTPGNEESTHLVLEHLDGAGRAIALRTFELPSLPARETEITAIAVDGNDDVVIGGTFTGSLDLGTGRLDAPEGGRLFAARYDAAGAPRWSSDLGDGGSLSGLESTPDGGHAFAGYRSSTHPESSGWFVGTLDPTGPVRWTHSFGTGCNLTAITVAADDLAVAGSFEGTLDLGTGPLVSHGAEDFFLARLDRTGALRWLAPDGTPDHDGMAGLAADALGNVIASGYVGVGLAPPSGLLAGDGGIVAGNAAFAAKVAPDGTLVWSAKLLGTDEGVTSTPPRVAIDAAGTIYAAGQSSRPTPAVYVARLDRP